MKHLGTCNLKTSRLYLRRFKVSDAQMVYDNWSSDEEVTSMLLGQHIKIYNNKRILIDWQLYIKVQMLISGQLLIVKRMKLLGQFLYMNFIVEGYVINVS